MDRSEELKERAQGVLQRVQQNAPNSRQLLGLVTILAAGGLLLLIGGLTLTGTLISAALITPVLIFFSPILVPLATVAFVTISGLLAAGAAALATLSVISWIYNYFKGRHPIGSDQVDAARQRIAETATHLKERAASQYDGSAPAA